MYSSNSCFEFCILQLKKKAFVLLCFLIFFYFFLTQVFCPSSMFSICAFFRKFLHGLWSFSLKCARRLSQTQTLPRDFLQKLHPGVESPSSLDDATLECPHVSAPWEVHWHPPKSKKGRQTVTTGRSQWRQVRELLNLSWNVWNKDAGPPLPVRNKNL